jgi:transposase
LVFQLIKRFRETGQIAPKPAGGGNYSAITAEGQKLIRPLLAPPSDLTLSQLCSLYQERMGIQVSLAARDRAWRRLGITRQNKTYYDPQRRSATVVDRTKEYFAEVSSIPNDQLVFLDEMGATLNLETDYGRSQKGQRAGGPKPTARGTRVSTVGALSSGGLKATRGFAGTMNGEVFLTFLTRWLLPILTTGQVLILDNASPHRCADVIKLLTKAGVKVIFLPPYSPHLNPIELGWSKVKTVLQTVTARTTETLRQALQEAFGRITPANAEAWFGHCL